MFRRLLFPQRDWPKSLDQSVENPLQTDRLPDTSAAELVLPTVRHTPLEDRRYARNMLLLGCLVALPIIVLQYFNLYGVWMAVHFSALISAFAAAVFTTAYLHAWPLLTRWSGALAVGIATGIALYMEPEPRAMLAMALLAAVLLADRFAQHLYWLRTSAHGRSRTIRRHWLWTDRWNPFVPQSRGLELYWLGPAIVAGAYATFVRSEIELPTGIYMEHFKTYRNVLLVLVLAPFVVEPLAAFVFGRPYVAPGAQLAAFRRSLISWFAYNRHGVAGPGVLQSPAGTHRVRQRMLLAVTVLFAAALAPRFNHGRDELARTTVQGAPRAARPAPDTEPQVPIEYPRDGKPRLVREREMRERENAGTEPVAPAMSGIPGAEGLELDERQQRLLGRMNGRTRERYLARLKKDAAARTEQEAALAREQAARDEHSQHAAKAQEWFDLFLTMATVWSMWLLYPLFAMVCPVLLSLAGMFAVAAPAAGLADPSLSPPEEDEAERGALTPWRWESLVGRLHASHDRTERESLFLGLNAADRSPVIVPREVFGEHAHLLGDSGSGKTSLGLAPLIAQLIRFQDCSIVVVDLKADDLSLFEGARREAHASGLRFRWFTNELGKPTYAFNPMMQAHFGQLSLYQRTDILTAALGLQYGTDYGRGFYSDANAELLHLALKARPDSCSFRELGQVLGDSRLMHGVNREVRRAATHLVTVVNRLAAHEPLNVTDRQSYPQSVIDNAIDLADVFREPQVVCFHLASALGTTTSAEMGRLALHSLLTASKAVGPKRTQVYLFIDEFQRIVAGNLELFLQTARSMNIGVILANQTLMDLKGAGIDLIPTVRANTRFKQVFAASDLQEQLEVIQSSGETIVHNRSWTEHLGIGALSGGVHSVASSETVTPRLRPNDVLLATDDPRQSIVHVRRGAGYAQYGGLPFVMTSTHHISINEYEQRRNADWPEVAEETLVARLDQPTQSLPPTSPGVQRTPELELAPVLFPDPVLSPPAGADSSAPAPQEAVPQPSTDPFDELWKSQQERRRRGGRSSSSQFDSDSEEP